MDKPPAVPPKKLAPRAGIQRKTKAEREAYAREEEARQQQRLAEAAARNGTAAPAGDSGRGRVRGRGGSHTTDRMRSETGGGVFGASVGVGVGRGRSARGEGSTEVIRELEGVSEGHDGLAAKLGLKGEADGDGEKRTSTKKKSAGGVAGGKSGDQPVYEVSDDDGEEGTTRDIERIWISSAEEGEDEQGPIGRKGKERAKQVIKGGLGLRPVRAPRQMRDGESARNGKAAGDGDEMDIDEQFKSDVPSSLELKKTTTRKRGAKVKETKGPAETIEEKAERLRYSEDVRKLKEEFGMPPVKTGADPPNPTDLDRALDDPRDGKLYLFQFPPLTPFLVDSESRFEVNEALEDPQATTPDATNKAKGKSPGSDVKKEEEGEDLKTNAKMEVPGALTARSMRLPPGLVGKLNVHRSGKISLDWGGTDLEIRYGNEVDFLQDAVVVGGEDGRSSWALGQVERKLVVIPDWQKLYD